MPNDFEDRTAIHELLYYFAFLCDTDQKHRIADEIFSVDATIDYGSGIHSGRDAVHAFFTGISARIAVTSHHIGNIAVRIQGDDARCHCRVIAWHWHVDDRADMKALPPATTVFVGGYQDELSRVDGRWKIGTRKSVQLSLGFGEIGALRTLLSGAADRRPDFQYVL